MTKQQIINFAKAPFSRSFGIAYILTLSNFLLIPLLSDFIYFFLKNYEKLDKMEIEEVKESLINSFLLNLSISHISMAVVGFCLSILLLNGYRLGLIHKTIVEKNDIFEASRIQLPFSFISTSTLKGILASLIYCILFFLSILASGGIIALGASIGEILNLKIISIGIGIAGLIFFFILLYKVICYCFTANLFFLSTLRISSLLHYGKVKSFFQANKSNIFIVFLLTYVSGQMLSVLIGSVISKIFRLSLIAGTITSTFDLGCYWILALGLLVFNFFWVYLSLLHAIVYGKIVLWLNKSTKGKNTLLSDHFCDRLI